VVTVDGLCDQPMSIFIKLLRLGSGSAGVRLVWVVMRRLDARPHARLAATPEQDRAHSLRQNRQCYRRFTKSPVATPAARVLSLPGRLVHEKPAWWPSLCSIALLVRGCLRKASFRPRPSGCAGNRRTAAAADSGVEPDVA